MPNCVSLQLLKRPLFGCNCVKRAPKVTVEAFRYCMNSYHKKKTVLDLTPA